MERARRAASNRVHSTFPLSASSCRSEWLSAALRYIASDEFSRLFTKRHGDAGRLFDDAAEAPLAVIDGKDLGVMGPVARIIRAWLGNDNGFAPLKSATPPSPGRSGGQACALPAFDLRATETATASRLI
jgi:hypothetical protein